MFKDSKATKFSNLQIGDSFLNYDGKLMTVYNVIKTRSGRIRLFVTWENQNPISYSNGPLIDRYIISQ